MEDRIYTIVVEQKEATWKSMIMDLVSSENMDPWNVDISALTSRYLERIRSMKNAELKISGKMLLCAALLLKVKSARLVGEDLNEFDRLIAQNEIDEDEFYGELEHVPRGPMDPPALLPRTPQARTRKVTVFDLVKALEKALETKHRRLIKLGSPEAQAIMPNKPIDVELASKQVYKQVREWLTINSRRRMKWSQLIPEEAGREMRLWTFIPLLHLGTARKLDIEQSEAFGDFEIGLPD